jgi:hypothetical protein
MAIPALQSARPYSAPPALLAGAGKLPGQGSTAPATTQPPGSSSDQVSLSTQGLALQAADVQKESAILSKLTRAGLANFIPNADKAQISFDQLTYSDSRNVSYAQSGNASAFHSDHQTSLSGTGHITTADGQVFEFSAELDVSEQTDISQIGDFGEGGGPSGAGGPPPQAGPGQNTGIVPPDRRNDSVQLHLPGLKDLEAASDRLLGLLQQLGPKPTSDATNITNTTNAANTDAQLIKSVASTTPPALANPAQQNLLALFDSLRQPAKTSATTPPTSATTRPAANIEAQPLAA